MQESAAKYMDLAYANNAEILAAAAGRLGRGIRWNPMPSAPPPGIIAVEIRTGK